MSNELLIAIDLAADPLSLALEFPEYFPEPVSIGQGEPIGLLLVLTYAEDI